MNIRHTGDLRQMRDAEHLLILRDERNPLCDHLRSAPADPRVDFIKHHACPIGIPCRNDGLDRERDAREFTARGDFLQRLFRLADIGGKQHRKAICTTGCILFLRRDNNVKTCLLHAEPLQLPFNLRGECRTDLLPLFRQLRGALFHALTEPCNRRIQFLYVHIIAFGGGDLCAQRFEAR